MTTIRLEITDGLNPILDKIAALSRGVALESLSVAGSKIQKGARDSFKREVGHHWRQEIIDEATKKRVLGKRKIIYDTRTMKLMGVRISYETGKLAKTPSMFNFISSYLMEKSMVVVIGGKNPGFYPARYENGEFVGNLKWQPGTSKASHAILHKLNFGEQNAEHRWDEGRKSISQFEGRWKKRNFMSKGYFSAVPAINEALNSRLLKLLDKSIKRVEIREQVVA